MRDFERRLRAAMASAAEQAPAGLLEGVRRRHRRHVRRVAAASVALAAAAGIVVPLAARELSGGTGPATSSPSAVATRGTVLRDCQSNNNGTLGAGWKAQSVHAGPVWFVYVRPASGQPPRLAVGNLSASAMVIAIANGHTAVVSAAPVTGGQFRFLAKFNSSGTPYTLAEGAPALTLSGCPAGPPGTGMPSSYAAGLTMFWEGYVTDLRGCIPLRVRATPASKPIRVTIAAGARCKS